MDSDTSREKYLPTGLVRAGRLLLALVVIAFVVGMPLGIASPTAGLWLSAPALVGMALAVTVGVGFLLVDLAHWAWTGNSWLAGDL